MSTIFKENFDNISTVKNIILHCQQDLKNALNCKDPENIEMWLHTCKVRINNALSNLEDEYYE